VLVGSREDLLWECRDLIGNPAMGIVDAVKETVQRLAEQLCDPRRIAVYFVEVYGKSIGGGAKNYSRQGSVGFRLFDVIDLEAFEELLSWPADKIASWRDHGGQPFVDVDRLAEIAAGAGFERVPPLFDFDAAQLPTDLEATHRCACWTTRASAFPKGSSFAL
jgi:hypothetical protein